MTTIGSGAPPGEPLGGGAIPAQHSPRPDTARRPSGREERRRIGELLAEAADTVLAGRVPGMPNASPWQRSNAVWHRAGIDWSRAEADPPRTSSPAGVPAAGAAANGAAPGVAAPGATGLGATVPAEARTAAVEPARTAGAAGPPHAPSGGDGAPGDEPWTTTRRRTRPPAVPVKAVGIAAVAIVVLGAGGYALFGAGDGGAHRPAATGAVAAGRMFAPDPAAKTSGRPHPLTSVAASGGTVVVAGSEQGGEYARAQFLTSADGGRTWHVADVRATGGDPPPGEYPQYVAGGGGAWAALGGTPGGMVAWTSRDARTWTRQATGGAFVPGDRVAGLARTGSGFVAVGTAAPKGGGTQAIVWVSGDGRSWTRLGPDRIGSGSGGAPVRMTGVAAHGDTVVARGVVQVTETVTKKVKRRKKKIRSTVQHEAFWRSADGGRTWAAAIIPQARGSAGGVVAMTSSPAGFFAAREASRRTGSKKHRRTVHYGVIFSSPDGQRWAAAGQVTADGYAGIAGLRGGDGGLACLVGLPKGSTAVLTSADGITWRRVGTVPAGPTIGDMGPAAAGPVVAGRFASGDPYLTVAGVGDVNVAAVPGAVHPERAVTGVVADAGRVVAVGSSNGSAAVWTSPNGSAWSRATLPAPGGPQPRRLAGVVHGAQGWLAVGRAGDRALVLASSAGGVWQAVTGAKVFGGAGLAPAAAAANGAGYVVVGAQGGTTAAAWYSPDLKTWSRADAAGKADLDGTAAAPKWMSDVAAGPAGFVAVGGQTAGKAARPAVWTSADGKKWALSAAPPALPQGAAAGALTTVVARGGVLVAAGITGAAGVTGAPAAGAPGSAAFAAVSADGGRTWQPVALPEAAPGSAPTAAVATAHGFVLAGTAGSDVLLWTSADGRTWRASRPHGFGLDGSGVQRLDGVTVMGRDILAVGFTGDSGNETPTLWRVPAP